jgi:hypothetical protein
MEAQLSPLQDVTHANAGDCASYRRYKNHQRPPPRCSGHWAAVRLREVVTEPDLWAGHRPRKPQPGVSTLPSSPMVYAPAEERLRP